MLNYFNKLLRYLFFATIVRFVVHIVMGVNVKNREKLPIKGPAIIVANHNSHLDTLVLISLFRLKQLAKIRPVAAADYFLTSRIFTWFSTKILGIIPIIREGVKKGIDPLVPCYEALKDEQILILFPEGTRGKPEQLSEFKKGVFYLAERYPDIPIIPVFMHGLGKSLPKGEFLLVPFFCDVFIGEPIYCEGDKTLFMQTLNERFDQLASNVVQDKKKAHC